MKQCVKVFVDAVGMSLKSMSYEEGEVPAQNLLFHKESATVLESLTDQLTTMRLVRVNSFFGNQTS